MHRLQIPSRLGNLKLIEFIAPGLCGEVYKAEYGDGTLVAVKVFQRERDSAIFGYFTNEQLLLREVRLHRHHPHIVEYITNNLITQPYFLATRYIEGSRELDQFLGRTLHPGFVLRVVEQIGNALDYLHYGHPKYSPIIHRDISPRNILIDRQGNAVLIDLSIARHPMYTPPEDSGLGTPRYMATEQYEGEEWPTTDQFALAAVALHMLTRRPLLPTNPREAPRALQKLRDSAYADLRRQLGIRAHTAEVIIKAMAYDPGERYASCEEFAYELRQAFVRDGLPTTKAMAPVFSTNEYRGYVAMGVVGVAAIITLLLSLNII
jgi:eukaryotic-like serine/threonine-protein kinase